MMINEKVYRAKVLGCWHGKAVGGTLGMISEGVSGENDLKFYRPVPDELAPNDDLELQVLWGTVLAQAGNPVVDRDVLADAWLQHNFYPCDEYAIARRNLQWGIRPPWSGRFGNFFTDGLGAAIRSELWACLAPGDPALAVRYAYEDACIDHAGNGLYAEIFFAALESAAFVENDVPALIRTALKYIPQETRLARAIRDTVNWCRELNDRRAVRSLILEHYRSDNFTDVVMNVPFVILALLLGDGDFGDTVCHAANCGYDTDCTAATAGAVFGIMHPERIPEAWLRPIGDKIVLSEYLVGLDAPKTIPEFTDMICDLRKRLKPADRHKDSTPDLSAGTVCWQSGLIPWADFRQDIFNITAVDRIQTYGWTATLPLPDLSHEGVLSLKTDFYIRDITKVRVMFNCDAWHRCFVDGVMRFGREAGIMMPASHRTAMGQFCDLELAPGKHELSVQIFKQDERLSNATFYFGIADARTKLWLPDVFPSQPKDVQSTSKPLAELLCT